MTWATHEKALTESEVRKLVASLKGNERVTVYIVETENDRKSPTVTTAELSKTSEVNFFITFEMTTDGYNRAGMDCCLAFLNYWDAFAYFLKRKKELGAANGTACGRT